MCVQKLHLSTQKEVPETKYTHLHPFTHTWKNEQTIFFGTKRNSTEKKFKFIHKGNEKTKKKRQKEDLNREQQ